MKINLSKLIKPGNCWI